MPSLLEAFYLFGSCALFMTIVMTALWWFQKIHKDASVVDAAWAAGLGATAIGYALLGSGDEWRRALLGILAGLWSFRLSIYLLLNRVIGKPEDARYQELREKWGDNAQRNFFLFFQFQAGLVVAFSIPYFVLATIRAGDTELRLWDFLGVGVWMISVVGESISDRQLNNFRKDEAHRGKTCQVGLWKYSRHPNYFFEWMHWWSYVLIAVGSPIWYLSLLGPALMYFFLMKVTGIPPTEARARLSRPDYADYQRTTSMFFPWFRKR